MCICINCRHIHDCKTYQFISREHNKTLYHKNDILFTPLNTMVNVNVNKKDKKLFIDWDLIECSSFVEKPGYWLNK
uniref:Ycf34 n=1 Tax=Chondria tumulosa TaxID=2740715 RepID=A0A896SR62_9FLOR|nr:hypothetical protein K8K75_pgp130 [Chondria tumulosa]QSD57077.1 hypothetical protein [Chondria tumulosa]